MKTTLRILHLSDLHIDKDHYREQRPVLRALFDDVAAIVRSRGVFDLVIFSGDLIAKGGYSDQNKALAIKEFIVPIMEAASISPEYFFLVPGNHDINLKEQSTLISSAQRSLTGDDAVAKYLSEAVGTTLATGLEGFNSILERLGPKSGSVLSNSHYSAHLLDINGVKLGLALFNTAWHATGAPLDGDYGKLYIGRRQFDDIVNELGDADVRLAIAHHPIAWLAPKDAQNTHRQLLLHFDAWFHGHNHEPEAQVSSGTSNSYFISNAGCLYQHRDYFNGYCVVEYQRARQSWHVMAREYFESRQAFDVAPRFGPNGEANFVRSGDGAKGAAMALPSDEYVEQVNGTFDSRLLSAMVSDVAPRSLKKIFVDPRLSRISQRKLEAQQKNGATDLFVSLKEVLQLKRSTVFLGAKDIGKTTLLQRIAQVSLDFNSSENHPFGAYVDLDLAGDTQASIIEHIVSFSGGIYRKSEILHFMKEGVVTVCFDNLSESNQKQYRAVRDICALFRDNRYYFSMLEDVDYSLSSDRVPKIVDEMDVLYIHPFGRRETRLLTQNWYGESAEECSAKVEDVLLLLGRLNVPRTPFLISALLWIREKGTQFSPVNQAEILDALIDGVMEKLSETKDRSRLDSTIKRHYLAALAEHLYYSGRKKIQSIDLEKFTISYFDTKGLPSPTAPFLADLKAKGILLEVGDDVIFMFEAIRAFFLSTRLHENPQLLEKALSKEHFLELGEELDYYTGRHRDQTDVLRRTLEISRSFLEDADLQVELESFDSIRIARPQLTGEGERNLRRATTQRPTAEQRQAILDSVDDQLIPSQSVERRREFQTGIGRYLEALRISSSILRNSELVSDVGLKSAGYSEFTDGWCRVLISVMSALERDVDGELNRLPGQIDAADNDPVLHLLEGLLPVDNPGMARYLKKLIVPNVIISIALEAIGTSKLQKIMEDHCKEAPSTVQRLLDVFLMVDLRLPRWTSHIEALLKDFHKNKYVSELVFSKLFQIFMLGSLRAAEEDKVKGLLAESISLMLSENRLGQKTRLKGNFLNNLNKKRLIRK